MVKFHKTIYFKDNASKLLLALMESNDDTANAERILFNIPPKALVFARKKPKFLKTNLFLNKI
jgi:hypothetical protein